MVQIVFPDRAEDGLKTEFSAAGERDGLVSSWQFAGNASVLAGKACARF
jgi:hypothetical protein